MNKETKEIHVSTRSSKTGQVWLSPDYKRWLLVHLRDIQQQASHRIRRKKTSYTQSSLYKSLS
jgi:hypothetical protein